MAWNAFGDSITAGVAASTPAKAWVALLGSQLNTTITNHGVSGHTVLSHTPIVYQTFVTTDDNSTLALGTNDERINGANTTKQGYFKSGLSALAVWLATPTKYVVSPASTAFETGWGANPPYTVGYKTKTLNAKSTFTVAGSVVYLGMTQQDNNSAVVDVTVDGVSAGSFIIGSSGWGGYGPYLIRIAGLAPGEHTVEVKKTAGSGWVYFDWFAGNEQAGTAKVYLQNILRAATYPQGGSDANVASYNIDVVDIVTNLAADGLPVVLVDANSAVNNSTDLGGSGYHPVDAGMQKIANKYYATITGGPSTISYSAVATYKGSDGFYYIDDGESRLKLLTQ